MKVSFYSNIEPRVFIYARNSGERQAIKWYYKGSIFVIRYPKNSTPYTALLAQFINIKFLRQPKYVMKIFKKIIIACVIVLSVRRPYGLIRVILWYNDNIALLSTLFKFINKLDIGIAQFTTAFRINFESATFWRHRSIPLEAVLHMHAKFYLNW